MRLNKAYEASSELRLFQRRTCELDVRMDLIFMILEVASDGTITWQQSRVIKNEIKRLGSDIIG